MSHAPENKAYKEAGVDIQAAAALVEGIKPHIAKTKRSGVMNGLGGFGALFDLKETGYQDPVLVSATDGVGTKIKIAIDLGIHDTIGIDCVAMCVNDLVVQGAEPMFFLDYFATGKLENNVAENVIKGIADGCAEAGCALIGGETAEMPGLYADGDYDIAGFSVGAVERDDLITGESVSEGDVILGLASSGVHSNGFSLVRKILDSTQGHALDSQLNFTNGKTLGETLLTPTRIYVKPILEALKVKGAIKAMAHITGGGFLENIPRVLPDNLTAEIDCQNWEMPALFKWLKEAGNLNNHDLSATLNCGIGMVVVCDKNQKDALIQSFKESGESVFELGQIISRETEPVILHNQDESWN